MVLQYAGEISHLFSVSLYEKLEEVTVAKKNRCSEICCALVSQQTKPKKNTCRWHYLAVFSDEAEVAES